MKKLKNVKRKKFLVSVLILLLFILTISPSELLNARACDDGLARCSVDAAMAGIFGGPNAFMYFSSVCLIGYSFCMRYYA